MKKWMNIIVLLIDVRSDEDEDNGNTLDDNSNHNEDKNSGVNRNDGNDGDEGDDDAGDELYGCKPAGQIDKVELSNSEVLLLVNPLYHGST